MEIHSSTLTRKEGVVTDSVEWRVKNFSSPESGEELRIYSKQSVRIVLDYGRFLFLLLPGLLID